MDKEDPRTFVNTPMDDDLIEKLDEMVEASESTRAQFIRLQIRRAYDEFQHMKHIKKVVVEPKIRETARK